MTEMTYEEWVDSLPLLEERKHYRLPNGMTIFVTSFKKWDSIIVRGKNMGGSIHVSSPNPEAEIESDYSSSVLFYDNLSIDMYGTAKKKPVFVIKDDEFPLHRIDLKLLEYRNPLRLWRGDKRV